MNTKLVHIYEKLVAHFGSQTLTAKALEVEQPSVNAWLKGKTKMSEKTALRAQLATKGKFKAVDLCPSLKVVFENLTA
jgi:DNA-binding transcriptional regulator YdaS (Cro superfamily)